MGAESPCLACADLSESLDLLPGQCMTPAFKELLSVLSEDIGDFRPMFAHFWRALSSEVQMGFTLRASKGHGAAWMRWADTRRYLAVV